jgi:hypothetical protein
LAPWTTPRRRFEDEDDDEYEDEKCLLRYRRSLTNRFGSL